ncbi:MAG: tetratricopeptide repeat protein [Balneola sp.]|nr:MAG: tetratricopeptide repeat protein [Balneola sp.]
MKENESDILKKIDAYLKGTLSDNEIDQLWVEFAKNPELLDLLELEVGVQKIIEDEVKGVKKAKTFQLPSWTWHASAAAVILLVLSIQLFQVDSKTRLDQFVISEISADQAETGDGVRAKDRIITTADSLLNLGFSALVSGNISQALSLYDEVINNYDIEPYGSKAFTNKGIILYNQGDYEASVESFDSALERIEESRMIEEKAHWYKGNALANLNRLEEARMSVYNAYSMDGIFRKPAFLLLQKLNYDLGYFESEETDAN